MKADESQRTNERLLRLREVKSRTGLSRSTIYLAVKNGSFPKPIRLGLRSIGWIESEIGAWILNRIEQSRF